MEPQLLTPVETAEFLKVSHNTLVNWRRSGVGPRYIFIGERLVRYRRSDLEHWLEEQSHPKLPSEILTVVIP